VTTRLLSRTPPASVVALLFVLPVAAQTLYENGPVASNIDAWTINQSFVVSDSFTISTGTSRLNGLAFGAWVFPVERVARTATCRK
jgi:hypothetical protein